MYPYLHIAAELHKYRTTEMHKAAERARLVANLAPTKTHSYSLWRYWFALGIVETLGLGSEDESYVNRDHTREADDASVFA